MKDDAPVPERLPRKRRELEDALDRWLAVWLAREDLTPSERRRLEEEKARRKALTPDVQVALIVGNEGMTPAQHDRASDLLGAMGATEVFYLQYVARHVRRLQQVTPMSTGFGDEREMLREATAAIATPKEPEKPNVVQGVWDAVRFAKHRKIPVRVVMPDGKETM